MKRPFKLKKKKDFDFGNRMDLNPDRYGPSATQSNIDFKKKLDLSQKAIEKRKTDVQSMVDLMMELDLLLEKDEDERARKKLIQDRQIAKKAVEGHDAERKMKELILFIEISKADT